MSANNILFDNYHMYMHTRQMNTKVVRKNTKDISKTKNLAEKLWKIFIGKCRLNQTS